MNIGEVVKGIFSYLFQDAITAIMQPFLNLLELVALSPDTLAKMAWIDQLYPTMQVIGAALLVLITMWQALKGMFIGCGIEADEPTHIAFKATIGMFMIFGIKDIMIKVIEMSSSMVKLLMDSFTQQSSGLGLYEIFAAMMSMNIIYIVLFIFLLFKCIGLFYRMFKRLVTCAMLILFAPLAVACMVAKPTAGFFSGFIKLFAGNIVIQILQAACFVIMQLSLEMVSGGTFAMLSAESVFGIMLTISVVSITNSLEDIVRDLSFGVGFGRDMQGAMGKIQGAVMTGSYGASFLAKAK